MRIHSVEIKNFRVFEHETIIFDDYTCLVGANGAGKSSILCALNVFFKETFNPSVDVVRLKDEDFYKKNTSQPIEITVTFRDLSDEAKDELRDYVRQDKLVVTSRALFDDGSQDAEVKQFGQRYGIKDFARFFDADKKKSQVTELKTIYEDIRLKYLELPKPTTKANMIDALHEFEEKHPEIGELIPSEDQFYGVSRGVNRLERHIQWIFVPAVKDASSEELEGKNTALGKLLSRTVRSRVNFSESLTQLLNDVRDQYQSILDGQQHVLNELSTSLTRRLIDWAHPEAHLAVEWAQDPEKSVRIDEPFAQVKAGEGSFLGKIARLGHGLQRSFLLAILQELSGSGIEGGPTLILACEEPELYQHPPQIRHMADVLKHLSTGDAQVLITTHSPYFVGGKGFEGVRLIRRKGLIGAATVRFLKFIDLAEKFAQAKGVDQIESEEGTLAKIHQELQPSINEIFFSPVLILVEGLEDVAYITTYMNLLGYSEKFRKFGCNIIPVNRKSNLLKPFIISKHLEIPTFIVFDSDGHQPDRNGSKRKHEIDNMSLLRAAGYTTESPFSENTLWKPDLVMWSSELSDVIHAEFPADELETLLEEIRLEYGHIQGLEKNILFISSWLTKAWQRKFISKSLVKLCEEIINFAESKKMV